MLPLIVIPTLSNLWHGKSEISTFAKSVNQMAETVQQKILTKEEILALLAQNRGKLRQMGVERIGLFGSFARNAPTQNSDIDLLVELEIPSYAAMIELYDFLSELLGSKVDLIRKGPHLRDRFLQTIEKDLTYA